MVTGMFNNDNYIVYSVMQCIKLKVVKKWGGLSRPPPQPPRFRRPRSVQCSLIQIASQSLVSSVS